MKTIEVALPEPLAGFVSVQAAARGYDNPGDYIIALLRREQSAREREDFEAKLLEGIESLERGEGTPITPEFWESLRARIRERFGDGEEEEGLPS